MTQRTETVYLSPAGDDHHDGSRQRPVATLERAVQRIRAAAPGVRRRVVVGGGVYVNTQVVLTAADNGLELVAARGAQPVFYGGCRIAGWRSEGDGSPFWIAEVAGVRDGAWDFRALVVNGRFALRARFPEQGAIRHASEFPVAWMSTTKGGWQRPPTDAELTTLRLVPGSLPAGISARNAELTLYHSWDESLVGIHEWDRETGVITFSMPAGHPPGAFGGWKEQARTFVVWNVREGMTRPGQWYLDRERGCIVYWPLAGETMETVEVLAPRHASVLRLEGTAEAPVGPLRIRGLTVGLTTTPLLAGGFGALKFAGAIEGQQVHGLRLENVTVRWAGGQAIRVHRTEHARLTDCTVCETGAGGIVLSGRDGVVARTLVHHVGRTYPSALALRVGGERWHVHHNTLHHTPYTAINAGGKALRLEHNRFHHIMEELVDGAAIYVTFAKSCVLRGNYTYAVRDEQVHAYYLDEQTEDSLVEGNVAEGVPWPIHNHMAWKCILRHNVCLHPGNLRLTFANCDAFLLDRNVFVCDGDLVVEPSCTGVAAVRRNCFFSRAGRYRWNFHDRLPSLEHNTGAIRLLPRDQGSLVADPGVRCDAGRISYGDRDLARRLGLRELDVSQAGCGRE